MLLTLFEPRRGGRYDEVEDPAISSTARELPAWPLYTLLYGFPFIWALGMAQFMPTILALIMLAYMVARREIVIFRAQWIWLALCVWTVVCTVSLNGGSDILAWGLRFVIIFNAGIYSIYLFNARERVTSHGILIGLIVVWYTVVILGWLSLQFPDFRLTTPMSMIMPGGLVSNDLVKDYVMPPLAEVQLPWGAPEPYVRPSAPFPYANSWGLAFTFLTPIVLATMSASSSLWIKICLGFSVIAGLVPAVATSNRGMFIGLAICVGYVIMRQVMAGNLKVAVWALICALLAVVALVGSGALAKILGRQEYSDSTGGRASLYAATWDAVMQSPVVGYGTARMNVSIGVSMGTQGYLWALMFCFGLVGLGLFLAFMVYSIITTWGVQSDAGMWIHSVPVTAIFVFVFYSFDTMQMAAMMLCLSLMMRSAAYREGL